MGTDRKPIPTETRRRLAAMTALHHMEQNAAALRGVLERYQEAVNFDVPDSEMDEFDNEVSEAVNALDETLSDWPGTRNDWLNGELRTFGDMEVSFVANEEDETYDPGDVAILGGDPSL